MKGIKGLDIPKILDLTFLCLSHLSRTSETDETFLRGRTFVSDSLEIRAKDRVIVAGNVYFP